MARPRASTFDRQRDTMLAAAAELFAERGYATASIADLARACGVSKGLLYHYYRDKEHLLFDIADRYLDTLRALIPAPVSESGAGEGREPASSAATELRHLIARFMTAYRDSAARHRVLVQDVKYLSPRHRNRINAKQNAVVDGLADAIGRVVPQLADAGARRAMLKPLTMTLFGMMNWTFTWLRDDGALTYEDMATLVADLFLGGVGSVGRARVATNGRAANGRAPRRAPNGRDASPGTGRSRRNGLAPLRLTATSKA